ncbi:MULTISPECIES: methionyl-tRNA formyltransferase [unclassified Oleiphilus]|uniref:methionyl-tRNA formyltransferase n=1 Tax=unclassified Oleiphilus TaxID=2631174 RepID=UPI0007C2E3A6|nr:MULTISPECIES: methionyl-tRNA formyltransferase [unclassified Oleiphilus]KZY42299.1 methionyl-tRNA formyltransferase [Oleiphilus sp. HI0050]KZY75565.1 methionyl-tRNA formyltransferase [Oleiphilus sp. HI0068]KZY79483.1 methionyl-tRNA formyltransferase [Oleiphilus sp. HI0069]KZZ20788.1 methionyl-tRNA formyltransferase [Oleiphilus sp. HI0081]KZZ34404.1 methionyl-tRNA formyltransferase [Oleiphilus sp. HI0085]
MKIIFAGTPEFAAKSLQAIIDQNHEVIAVYTQPDRPAGRGKKLVKSEVKQVAEAHGIPVFQPEKLTNPEAQTELAALKADLMIVAAYGLLLPKAVLDMPTFGCINIHASLLPRWRGAAPIQRAIQEGDRETGITIMQMDVGLDTGDMLLKLKTDITDQDTGGSLHDRLAEQGASAILQYLEQRETLAAEPQDNELANYAHKLSKQEACINWQDSAQQICRNIRAFNPWPVSFLEFLDAKGKVQRVRIFEASEVETNDDRVAGTILEKTKNGIIIQCGQGAISIQQLQLPGAKAMDVQSFVNGGKALLNAGEQLNVNHDN